MSIRSEAQQAAAVWRGGSSEDEKEKLIADKVHFLYNSFVRIGSFAAFELSFNRQTRPIPLDESCITALDINSQGMLYGATSSIHGRTHLFAGLLQNLGGGFYNLGPVEGYNHCPKVICTSDSALYFLSGPAGSSVFRLPYCSLPGDMIQESFHVFPELQKICRLPEGYLTGAVRTGDNTVLALAGEYACILSASDGQMTGRHLFHPSGPPADIGNGGIIRNREGEIFICREDQLNPTEGFRTGALTSSFLDGDGTIILADTAGRVYSFSGTGKKLKESVLTITPVTAVARTGGVTYGFCGDGIQQYFRILPGKHDPEYLGAVVSVIERRRYGCSFTTPGVKGPSGQLFWGENDNHGHVFIYFPLVE